MGRDVHVLRPDQATDLVEHRGAAEDGRADHGALCIGVMRHRVQVVIVGMGFGNGVEVSGHWAAPCSSVRAWDGPGRAHERGRARWRYAGFSQSSWSRKWTVK